MMYRRRAKITAFITPSHELKTFLHCFTTSIKSSKVTTFIVFLRQNIYFDPFLAARTHKVQSLATTLLKLTSLFQNGEPLLPCINSHIKKDKN